MTMRKITVIQDGSWFYSRNTDRTRPLIESPGVVHDWDLRAAERARAWFVEDWCPAHDVEPIWEGEG